MLHTAMQRGVAQLQRGCWESNPSLLEEQPRLLAMRNLFHSVFKFCYMYEQFGACFGFGDRISLCRRGSS